METVLFVWLNKHKIKATCVAVGEKKMEKDMSLDAKKIWLGAAG
jgi:hypothetical protein